jgi:hypothetical protein
MTSLFLYRSTICDDIIILPFHSRSVWLVAMNSRIETLYEYLFPELQGGFISAYKMVLSEILTKEFGAANWATFILCGGPKTCKRVNKRKVYAAWAGMWVYSHPLFNLNIAMRFVKETRAFEEILEDESWIDLLEKEFEKNDEFEELFNNF